MYIEFAIDIAGVGQELVLSHERPSSCLTMAPRWKYSMSQKDCQRDCAHTKGDLEIGQMASVAWENRNLSRKRTWGGARYEKLNRKGQFSAAV